MTNPHRTMSQLTDPHPVRPGTSAALTARTIDATIHPPLVRAQEAVAAFIPRVSAPLADSPLLFAMLGATLIFVWVAHRAKYRPSALLLSAALVMGLTSFHPVGNTDDARIADSGNIVEEGSATSIQVDEAAPVDETMPAAEDAPSDEYPTLPEVPEAPDAPDAPDSPDSTDQPMDDDASHGYTPSYVDVPVMPVDAHERMISPEVMRQLVSPEAIRRMMTPEEMAVVERERAQLRVVLMQMRRQLRDEARRMAKKRYY